MAEEQGSPAMGVGIVLGLVFGTPLTNYVHHTNGINILHVLENRREPEDSPSPGPFRGFKDLNAVRQVLLFPLTRNKSDIFLKCIALT